MDLTDATSSEPWDGSLREATPDEIRRMRRKEIEEQIAVYRKQQELCAKRRECGRPRESPHGSSRMQ